MLTQNITATTAYTVLGTLDTSNPGNAYGLIVRHPGTGPGATVTIYDSIDQSVLKTVYVDSQVPAPGLITIQGDPFRSFAYKVDVANNGTLPAPGLLFALYSDANAPNLLAATLTNPDGLALRSTLPVVDARPFVGTVSGAESVNIVAADGTPQKVLMSVVKANAPITVSGGYDTKANLLAAAALYEDRAVLYVTNDSTAANNGEYRKSGALGGGTFVQSSFSRVALAEASVVALGRIKQDFAAGKNKFDPADPEILTGKYIITPTGNIGTSAAYSVTGYIRVVPGTSYTVSFKYTLAWYDKDRALLLVSSDADSNKTQVAPANSVFLRCTVINTSLPTFQVEELAGGVSSTYEPFHSVPELFPRTMSLEGCARYAPLAFTLSDAGELSRAGATLQAGVLGTNPAISLPYLHALPLVIETDFKFSADPNIAAAPIEICSLNQAGNATPWFKLELEAKAPTVGYYVPTYAMDCKVVGAAAPTTQSFVPPLGPDVFSIRKVAPVLADVTIVCEVTTDRVKLYNGGTSIGEWLFSGYSTMVDLTAAMRVTLGADYVVVDYNVAGVVPSDLGVSLAYVCKAIAEVNATTGVATGATIYDSFETFFPTRTTAWHRLRIEITPYAPNPTFVSIIIYLGTTKIFQLFNGVNLKTTGPYTLHLNYTTTGGTSALAPMRNFSLSHVVVPLPRFACIMTHVLLDGAELPATGSTLQMTSGRLKRIIATAKKYGWSFGTPDEFIDMVMGNKVRRDKTIFWTMDDSLFGWDTVAECNRILDQNGIKFLTGIVTNPGGVPFDFAAIASALLRRRLSGNAVCSHASIHVNLQTLSYAQFIANVNLAVSQLLAAGYDCNSIILPGGGQSLECARWMQNNGYAAAFGINIGTAGRIANFGYNRMVLDRTVFDDYVAFSLVDTVLNV